MSRKTSAKRNTSRIHLLATLQTRGRKTIKERIGVQEGETYRGTLKLQDKNVLANFKDGKRRVKIFADRRRGNRGYLNLKRISHVCPRRLGVFGGGQRKFALARRLSREVET